MALSQKLNFRPKPPSFSELFTPKSYSVFREGYDLEKFRADAIAGLTVAIVALPLSMAIAIASGVGPERGLYTAVIGGFLISALGGSRYQIGGPAGAFIVLIAAIVEAHGYHGLVLATVMAGAMMIAVGLFRLGTYIKYIPFPVTVGFTAAIAVIIFSSQIKELLGLHMEVEPAAFLPKLSAIGAALPTVNISAVLIASLALGIIVAVRHYRPNWPSFLIAVVATAVMCWLFELDIATIGSRFGGIPSTLPAPSMPEFSWELAKAVFPSAVAIALLGSIESLLSAVVADSMSGRRHRSNCELVAQGTANIASVMFGGIPVTGTIARTATNIRAGAASPISGILHAFYVLIFMVIAAPLASYIPLATLGAVLAIVAWNMAERHDFLALARASSGDRLVLMATFLLTIFADLTIGIAVGVVLGAFLFLHRMAEAIHIQGEPSLIAEDQPDRTEFVPPLDTEAIRDGDIMVYRINGAFFFGATANVNAVFDGILKPPRILVLDIANVSLVDSTATKLLISFVKKLNASGTKIYIAGASRTVRRTLLKHGLSKSLARYFSSAETAIAFARPLLKARQA